MGVFRKTQIMTGGVVADGSLMTVSLPTFNFSGNRNKWLICVNSFILEIMALNTVRWKTVTCGEKQQENI